MYVYSISENAWSAIKWLTTDDSELKTNLSERNRDLYYLNGLGSEKHILVSSFYDDESSGGDKCYYVVYKLVNCLGKDIYF